MASTTTMFLTGASTVSNFAAQRQQAGAVMAQGEYSKRIADWNASAAERQAADAVSRGATDSQRQLTATKGLIGSQRAALAAQGIEVDSGSALDVQTDSQTLGELDALTIRNNAAREAFGFTTQASNYRQQGNMDLLAANNKASGIRAQSYGTLLTGVAQTYGQYRQGRPSTPSTKTPSTPKGTSSNWTGGDLG